MTRDGEEVAELVPAPHPRRRVSVLVDRRQMPPRVDPVSLRADIDELINRTSEHGNQRNVGYVDVDSAGAHG